MRYGNDDQRGQDEIEARRLDQRRRIQLALMGKARLRAELTLVLRKAGMLMLREPKMPRKELITAILEVEQVERWRTAHLVEFGDGHERCVLVDGFAQCPEAIVSRETSGEQA